MRKGSFYCLAWVGHIDGGMDVFMDFDRHDHYIETVAFSAADRCAPETLS